MRFVTLLALAACGAPAPEIADYDAACQTAADCAVVYTSLEACSCACDAAGLTVAAAADWNADVAEWLEGEPMCDIECQPCPDVEAVCEGATEGTPGACGVAAPL
jgi:hypothetical protein